jgi:hypothetical protein
MTSAGSGALIAARRVTDAGITAGWSAEGSVLAGPAWRTLPVCAHRALQHNRPAGRAYPPVEVTDMHVLRRNPLGDLIHEYAQVA